MEKSTFLNPASRAGMTALTGLCLLAAAATAGSLKPGEPILLPGTSGGFDFIRLDAANQRLLLGHEGNHSFDVFDLNAKQLLKVVPTSTSQDAVADAKNGKYYVSGNDPSRLVVVDATTLAITGEVPVPSDTDLIAYNPTTGLVHLCNDKGPEQWVIDPAAKKIVTTIKFAGSGVEDLAFDPADRHLYQVVKGANTVAVIDPADNTVKVNWPCAPGKGVHGIAMVTDLNGLLVACAGKLLLFDCDTGKVVDTAPTASGVDEMAYDPGLHQAYCASRQGKITTVAVAPGKLAMVDDTEDQKGTGDIVVDPTSHTVWIAYAKGKECYVQPFTPKD